MKDSVLQKLISLYGQEKGKITADKLEKIITEAKSKIVCVDKPLWNEKDVALITYPDSFRQMDGQPNGLSLHTLQTFLTNHLKDTFSIIHLLPFFPYSSDRGFSVIDYRRVGEDLGDWEDVGEIGKEYRLMVDLVLNHISVQHEWFQKFLRGDEGYEGYFISFKKEEIPQEELKKVSRPRATPLLTPFKTAKGERWVWTTFSVENSTDQVDLNYKNPEVLLEFIKIILFYLQNGVRIFRLDSIPYIWKEVGTDCKNLPQVHTIVSLFREILDIVCPAALIVTQASVTFEENLSYFGEKDQEAQLIYNFVLPTAVLADFYSQKARYLNILASRMIVSHDDCSFLNILAVHDGIGVSGAKGLLSDQDLTNMYQKIKNQGGMLSYHNLFDGTKTVVEMNTTWWSALNNPSISLRMEEPFELQLQKFITSYAIAMSLAGIPAVYYLSLIGGENDLRLFEKTGTKRDINRTNYDFAELVKKLSNDKSREARVFKAMTDLIQKRKSFSAFHPNARQEVLTLDPRVFALLRSDGSQTVLAMHNLSKQPVEVKYKDKIFELKPYGFEWTKMK